MRPTEKDEYKELKKSVLLTERQRERLAYLSMRNKQDQRNHWGPLWDWLTFLLYRFDIEGLCGDIGCPYTEYESEVELILPKLADLWREEKFTHAQREEEIKTIFKEVFDKMFSASSEPGHNLERFTELAKAIMCFYHGLPLQFSFDDVLKKWLTK